MAIFSAQMLVADFFQPSILAKQIGYDKIWPAFILFSPFKLVSHGHFESLRYKTKEEKT